MVTSATNFSRSGFYDWMAQRVSTVVPAAYAIFLLGYLVTHPSIPHANWHGLFLRGWMRIFSLLTLVVLSVHAWVDMRTISTDCLISTAPGKAVTVVRFLFQAVYSMVMFTFLV